MKITGVLTILKRLRDFFVKDAEFTANLSYNDETGKAYASYAIEVNGEITVIGKSFDTQLTPITSDGLGYSGAYVYSYSGSGFWNKAYYYSYELTPFSSYLGSVDPQNYFDGTNNWSVNTSGRIIGLAPQMGTPPFVGKKGGGKTGKKINVNRKQSWANRIDELNDRMSHATTKAEKEQIKKELYHARLKQKSSENHANRGQGY